MKRILAFILPWFLVACAAPALSMPAVPSESVFDRTKLFALTAEAETQTSGYPANEAMLTAIMSSKYALGTAMAATLTAQPSGTPAPDIPADSPFCELADLKTTFGSNAATQQILLGVGLTNISRNPCFLQAWLQVVLVDQQGHPLDVEYHYFEMGPADAQAAATEQARESTIAKVGILPGWTVWLNLVWSNWCGDAISGGVVIRLTLIENGGVLNVPTAIEVGGACNAPGYASSVGISKLNSALPPK